MKFSLFIPGILALIIFSTLPFTGRSQEMKEILMRKTLDLDTSLTNYASPIKPKIPVSNRKMPKIRAGSFRIHLSERGRSKKGKESSRKDLLEKTSMRTVFRDAKMQVLYEQTDTISVLVKFETTFTNTENTGLGRMLSGKDKSESSITYECREMSIYLPGDTSPWRLELSLLDPVPGNSTDYFGNLIRGNDTITVQYAKGFKAHKKIWKGYATGLIFTRNERQLAAFQFGYKKYIWISTREEKGIQQMLGSFILVYLATKEQ